jgi:hypothetical protein
MPRVRLRGQARSRAPQAPLRGFTLDRAWPLRPFGWQGVYGMASPERAASLLNAFLPGLSRTLRRQGYGGVRGRRADARRCAWRCHRRSLRQGPALSGGDDPVTWSVPGLSIIFRYIAKFGNDFPELSRVRAKSCTVTKISMWSAAPVTIPPPRRKRLSCKGFCAEPRALCGQSGGRLRHLAPGS